MYLDGNWESDAYQKLKDPVKLREYLIELNLRMFHDEILPAVGGDKGSKRLKPFNDWFKQIFKRGKIQSVVNAHAEAIWDDLRKDPDFVEYINRPTSEQNSHTLFTTSNEYELFEITFTATPSRDILIKIQQDRGKINLALTDNKLYHYEGAIKTGTNQNAQIPENPENPPREIIEDGYPTVPLPNEDHFTTKFTYEQLLDNADQVRGIWHELFNHVPEDILFKRPLNIASERFAKLFYGDKYGPAFERIIRNQPTPRPPVAGSCAAPGQGRRKRVSKCAFVIDEEGNIISIDPEEFVDVYQAQSEEGRKQMIDLIKNNGDKYEPIGGENDVIAIDKINQLIHHDEFITHTGLVETAVSVPDYERWTTTVPKKPSEMLAIIHEAVSLHLGNIRLSATKLAFSLSKNPFIEAATKAGKPLGYLLLAKGIIDGILHNDTTSLAIIGGRVGYDVVTDGAVALGTEFFEATSVVGRGARVLGEVAGPIGGVIDIGLGIWTLTNSIDRLRTTNNAYDKADAVVDIVSAAANVVISAVTTVVAVAVPPLAPIVFAIGILANIAASVATGIAHALIAVIQIGSQIHLSLTESIFAIARRFFDVFGTYGKDYLDYIVADKSANDLEVQSYLEFLGKYKQFSGVVFPSRTLFYSGKCRLESQHCLWGTLFGRFWCDDPIPYNYGCDYFEECNQPGDYICQDDVTIWRFWDCQCDGETNVTFGNPYTNNAVDFRGEKNIYWERAVPGDVAAADFKCKPGSEKYRGWRVDERQERTGYLCQNAISLNRHKNELMKDQSLLVNLEDGKDKFFVDQMKDNTPYTFWLGEEGEKEFWGGSDLNEFILNGNCSMGLLKGVLHGGPKNTDTLVISPSCAPGYYIQIISNSLHFEGAHLTLDSMLDIEMYSIENIVGRPSETEYVEVGCSIKGVFLNGGVDSAQGDAYDHIWVPPNDDCQINVNIAVDSYTFVKAQADADINVYVGEHFDDSHVYIYEHVTPPGPGDPPKKSIIFTKLSSQYAGVEEATGDSFHPFSHSIRNPETKEYLMVGFPKYIDNDKTPAYHNIVFNDSSEGSPNTYSILVIPNADARLQGSRMVFYHNVKTLEAGRLNNLTRFGNENIQNIFNISATSWNVIGGKDDDTFGVHVPLNQIFIDGKEGNDTLLIAVPQMEIIDLQKNDRYKNIERVVMAKGTKHIEIISACDTQLIGVRGEDNENPDILKLSGCSTARLLQIEAGGATKVIVQNSMNGASEYCRVVAHRANEQTPFSLDLDTLKAPNISNLILHFTNLSLELIVMDPYYNRDENIFYIEFRDTDNSSAVFKTQIYDGDEDSSFITLPNIEITSDLTAPVRLVFRPADFKPVIIHTISDKAEANNNSFRGFLRIENLYELSTTKYRPTIKTGGKKDTLVSTSMALINSDLMISRESDTTLVVRADDPSSSQASMILFLDLSKKEISLSEISTTKGNLQGEFDHIAGRTGQSDEVRIDCWTRSVAGQGGVSKTSLDKIIISNVDKCDQSENNALNVYISDFTRIENSALIGKFNYFLDLTEYPIYLEHNIIANTNNAHKFVFNIPELSEDEPLVNIDKISFDSAQSILKISAKDKRSNEAIYEFQMFRDNNSDEYLNPSFLVSSVGISGVSASIRITSNGYTVSTFLVDGDCSFEQNNIYVKGLPVSVNNFLLNISTGGEEMFRNCRNIVGYKGSIENHYWIYGLPMEKPFEIRGFEVSEIHDMDVLHLGSELADNSSILIDLTSDPGFLMVIGDNGSEVYLQNINSFDGRNNSKSFDVIIASCKTKQISGMDRIQIYLDEQNDCTFNLIIGLEPITMVEFLIAEDTNIDNLEEFWNSTFNYRLNGLMSFELEFTWPGMIDDTKHHLLLPLSLNEIARFDFDFDDNKLYYETVSNGNSNSNSEYFVVMITEPDAGDQYYTQPSIVTQDGFNLLIGTDSSITVTTLLKEDKTDPLKLLSKYQSLVNKLVITMVLQTNTSFLHIGNDGTKSDRNVLQNVGYTNSYMGGGGAADSIYEIISMEKETFISTGLEFYSPPPAMKPEGSEIAKQTIVLTDMVTIIRLKTGLKYKPTVTKSGDHLIITMKDFETLFPGKLTIFNATKENVREKIQILLGNALMEFQFVDGSWSIEPLTVQLDREIVHSIAVEDLEYNTKVFVPELTNSPEYRFKFNYSRNDDDLLLSDIKEFKNHKYDQKHIEMTTVIVTDFYKNDKPPSPCKNINDPNELCRAPNEIRNVTVILPGINVWLNGTTVSLLDNPNSTPSRNIDPRYLPVPIVDENMPRWNDVLHEVEESLVEDLPFENIYY